MAKSHYKVTNPEIKIKLKIEKIKTNAHYYLKLNFTKITLIITNNSSSFIIIVFFNMNILCTCICFASWAKTVNNAK